MLPGHPLGSRSPRDAGGPNPKSVSPWLHPGLAQAVPVLSGNGLEQEKGSFWHQEGGNAFLAGIDSSKACVKDERGSRGSFQRNSRAGKGNVAGGTKPVLRLH